MEIQNLKIISRYLITKFLFENIFLEICIVSSDRLFIIFQLGISWDNVTQILNFIFVNFLKKLKFCNIALLLGAKNTVKFYPWGMQIWHVVFRFDMQSTSFKVLFFLKYVYVE